MSREVRRRTTCRVCGADDLELILELGPTPLANAFLESPDDFADERSYALDLYFCRGCSLLQLLDVVSPEVLFRHYLYVTGTSTTMAAHNRAYAQTLVDLTGLTPADLVVDLASNDGSLLRCFQAFGVRTLGVEPATNLATHATETGVETINDFFTGGLASRLHADHQPARLVLANNVLGHVDDPVDFLGGCRDLLTDDGLIVIEIPYARDLVDSLEYDTVYHEHLSYFSVTALLRLSDRVGLSVLRIDRVDVHGGSLRLYMAKSSAGPAAPVLDMASDETRDGLTDTDRYHRFAEEVAQSRTTLVDLLEQLTSSGQRVVGYGAPAKGNTLLNYCGIDTRLLPYTVDKNPLKVGRFTPGAHIPVCPVSALSDGEPVDYVLILAWNVAREIMQQQQAIRERGARFIVPVPRVQVV